MSDVVKGDFNYGSVDAEAASSLEHFATRGKALLRKSQIQFIADMGKILSEARASVSHHGDGVFVKWAKAEFDVSHQTIWNYVNAWEKCLSNGLTNYLNWSATAVYLAASDDIPSPVFKKLERLPSTGTIRSSDVKRLIEASKPKPNPDDDVPFDAVPAPAAKPLTQAELKVAERVKAAAAKAKAKAEAAAAKKKEKEAAAAEKLKAKEAAAAEKAKAKEDAAGARQKAKDDAAEEKAEAKAAKEAAKLAALSTDGQSQLNRKLAQSLIDKAVRAVDALHDVKPNHAKRVAAIKLLQGVVLW